MAVFVCVVVSIVLTGCNSHAHGTKACYVSAAKRGVFVDHNKMNRLMLVETQDNLFAKIMVCGDTEFFLGDKHFSARRLLPEGLSSLGNRKSGYQKTLTCADAMTVFPPNDESTFDLLEQLCRSASKEYVGYLW
jgi:hypothetical protein